MTMAKPSAITNKKEVGLWSCQESHGDSIKSRIPWALLNEKVAILKRHIFIKRCQVKSYNDVKVNLKTNEIILHVDFNENYKNQQ